MAHRDISRENHQKPDSGKNSAFTRHFLYRSPGLANDINSGNGQRAVAQIHYQCPTLADERSMAIDSNESSKCVGCQANFVPW
jgi:hypothetical protein